MQIAIDFPVRLELRLGLALAVSVLFHAALLATMLPVGPGSGTSQAARAVVVPGTIVARRAPAPTPAAQPAAAATTAKPQPAPKRGASLVPEKPPAPEPARVQEIPPTEPSLDEAPIEALVVAGIRYFRAGELDVRATPIEFTEPEFPLSSNAKEGYIVLRLLINRLGTIDEFKVLISDPEGEFDEVVERSFGKAKFTPAIKDGLAVPSEMVIEVKFASAAAAIEAQLQALKIEPVEDKP